NESVWLDVTYTGEETIGNLSDRIKDFVKAFSNVEILSIRDNKTAAESDEINNQAKSIDDITPLGMLDLFFDEKKIADDKREIFAKMYEEILLKAEIEE
ncbi:MAG: exonuclease SbcCD subunit D C-terminal domain-containing protein, partial [Synergistaceae bacterium]|nr:exonuclease SbcCD subunit D C-terminal domain-containing protein [Synergistaceae bacterium]